MNKENWYESFFNGIAIKFWQKVVTTEYTQSEINFIKTITSLSQHENILDAPCGFGRHALALAKDGHSVTAIDISEEYITHLSSQAKQLNLDIKAIHADVLQCHIEDSFHVALCLGNSFNYFSAEKMKVFIKKIYSCLKADGYFINSGTIAESILPSLKDRNWMQVDDILYLNENTYHAADSVLQTNYQFIQNGQVELKTAYHFVYTLAEVKRILFDAGFSTIEVYGGFDLHEYNLGDKQAYFKVRK